MFPDKSQNLNALPQKIREIQKHMKLDNYQTSMATGITNQRERYGHETKKKYQVAFQGWTADNNRFLCSV
jgi:hypothetical protein